MSQSTYLGPILDLEQYIYIRAKVYIIHTATMAQTAKVIHHCTLLTLDTVLRMLKCADG